MQNYGMSVMRNIIANSVEEGYIQRPKESSFYTWEFSRRCRPVLFIQVFLWAKGKIKGWHLVASIIDLILVIVITVGRWEVFTLHLQ